MIFINHAYLLGQNVECCGNKGYVTSVIKFTDEVKFAVRLNTPSMGRKVLLSNYRDLRADGPVEESCIKTNTVVSIIGEGIGKILVANKNEKGEIIYGVQLASDPGSLNLFELNSVSGKYDIIEEGF